MLLLWAPEFQDPHFHRHLKSESVGFYNKNDINPFILRWINNDYWKLHPKKIICSFIRKRAFEYVSASCPWWLFCTRETPVEKQKIRPCFLTNYIESLHCSTIPNFDEIKPHRQPEITTVKEIWRAELITHMIAIVEPSLNLPKRRSVNGAFCFVLWYKVM